jgi:hypothetical protein
VTLRPAEQRERSCSDKVRLADEGAARAVAMTALQSGTFRGAKAWVYPCRYCRGFHITSKYGAGNLPGAVTASSTLVIAAGAPH